jgi:hypothetical protein
MKESKLIALAVGFHDMVNSTGRFLYKQVRRNQDSIPPDEAIINLDSYVRKELKYSGHFDDLESNKDDLKNTKDKLKKFGEHYLPIDEIKTLKSSELEGLAANYDWLGLIPQNKELPENFVYRANTMLFLHKIFREDSSSPKLDLDKDKLDISLGRLECGAKLVRVEDIKEANKRIPFHMDLSWVAAFVDNETLILSGAYGACLTMPKYCGLGYIFMRERYKTREKFLKVLAHEMTHMGTVHLDTRRDLLETKAYTVGSASFGEYTIALNAQPGLITKGLKFGIETIVGSFIPITIPESLMRIWPKIHSAIEISANRKIYRLVKERLHNLFGKDKGNYFLGRLTADEIEEFAYTNNLLASIDKKQNLKWKIMKRNSATLKNKRAKPNLA